MPLPSGVLHGPCIHARPRASHAMPRSSVYLQRTRPLAIPVQWWYYRSVFPASPRRVVPLQRLPAAAHQDLIQRYPLHGHMLGGADGGDPPQQQACIHHPHRDDDDDDEGDAATTEECPLPSHYLPPLLAAAPLSIADLPSGLPTAPAEEASSARGPSTAQQLKEVKAALRRFYDKVYYGDLLPPVGSKHMSYARFVELLYKKRIKRIYLLGDGQVALLEIPSPGWASDYDREVRTRDNPDVPCFPEKREWEQEKVRYYVELPADAWDDGSLLQLIKDHQPLRPLSLEAKRANLLMDHEVVPELVVLDTASVNAFLNQYAGQFLPILGLLLLRVLVGTGDWVLKKMGRVKKSSMQQAAEQFTRFKGKEFNVDDKGKPGASTGVSYKDIAGIDHVLRDVDEVMAMLMGSEQYAAAGAKAPKGILLEGPPGTGKTYLARAMAGQYGLPFFSANGAEFVEMFSGTAAARIRDLFERARKRAPAIIFIDEIDAIGRARGTGPIDPGAQEREQGLLQLLYELDGFTDNSKVLLVGATNRVDILDDALLRPGRLDRVVYMGRPTTNNRKRILQVHVRNKPIPRDNDDELLQSVAELAVGFSGAELANLLNEAAILAVRKNKAEIDFTIMLEAMEKVKYGLPQSPLPDGQAKQRLTLVHAARAVALALTPGVAPIKRVSMRPRGEGLASILYVPQEEGRFGGQWHEINYTTTRINAVDPPDTPLSVFERCCGLLVPLYAPRAAEEVFFGKEGVTTSTGIEMSTAMDLATWLVVSSTLHPRFRDSPVLTDMEMGGFDDPTTQGMEVVQEPVIVQLLEAAYDRALRLVHERRNAIEQVAQELLADKEAEAISGERLVEIIDTTSVTPLPTVAANGTPPAPTPRTRTPAGATAGQSAFAGEAAPARVGSVSFVRTAAAGSSDTITAGELYAEGDFQRALDVLVGRRNILDFVGPELYHNKAAQVRKQLIESPGALERLDAVRRFPSVSAQPGLPMPPPTPPQDAPVPGIDLEEWRTLPQVVEY